MAGHGQHGSGLREQLHYELGCVLPDVPTDKLRTLLLAARVWAHPGDYEEEDGNAPGAAPTEHETAVCSDKRFRFVPAGDDGPWGGKAG